MPPESLRCRECKTTYPLGAQFVNEGGDGGVVGGSVFAPREDRVWGGYGAGADGDADAATAEVEAEDPRGRH